MNFGQFSEVGYQSFKSLTTGINRCYLIIPPSLSIENPISIEGSRTTTHQVEVLFWLDKHHKTYHRSHPTDMFLIHKLDPRREWDRSIQLVHFHKRHLETDNRSDCRKHVKSPITSVASKLTSRHHLRVTKMSHNLT